MIFQVDKSNFSIEFGVKKRGRPYHWDFLLLYIYNLMKMSDGSSVQKFGIKAWQ